MFNRYSEAKDKRADAAEDRKGSMDGLLEAKFDKRIIKQLKPTRGFQPTQKSYRFRRVGNNTKVWKGCNR